MAPSSNGPAIPGCATTANDIAIRRTLDFEELSIVEHSLIRVIAWRTAVGRRPTDTFVPPTQQPQFTPSHRGRAEGLRCRGMSACLAPFQPSPAILRPHRPLACRLPTKGGSAGRYAAD